MDSPPDRAPKAPSRTDSISDDREQRAQPIVDDQLRDELHELGYAPYVVADNESEGTGVILSTEDADPGLNLFLLANRSPVSLMSNDGELVQQWQIDPEHLPGDLVLPHLLPNGDLLVLGASGLVKYSWDNELIWLRQFRGHHDLAVDSEGRIHALEKKIRLERLGGETVPVLDNLIVTFTPSGERIRTFSLWDLLHDRVAPSSLTRLVTEVQEILKRLDSGPIEELPLPEEIEELTKSSRPADLLHANSIDWIPPGKSQSCSGDSFLLSLRELDELVCIGAQADSVEWSWGASHLERQHSAEMLPTGNILVFDNGSRRGWSRILEIEPVSQAIVWQYSEPRFFSIIQGGVTKLDNGNVLITSSKSGRTFEVLPDGTKVWEYLAPMHKIGETEARGAIYRFDRLSLDSFTPELRQRLEFKTANGQ